MGLAPTRVNSPRVDPKGSHLAPATVSGHAGVRIASIAQESPLNPSDSGLPGWNVATLIDDIRPLIADAVVSGRPFALATIARARGGPRPVGSQMLVTADDAWGFLSGGCIEDDVARHARDVLRTGKPRWLIYGEGSPFIDMRLPCGGRLEVLVEAVPPFDSAIERLLQCRDRRRVAYWASDGLNRDCWTAGYPEEENLSAARVIYAPAQRLAVVGTDPFALAIAAMGNWMGWETTLIAPFGPSANAPFGLHCIRDRASTAISTIQPDAWTAIALATHDIDIDEEALVAAFDSDAGYIGLLGSRRRLPARLARLRRQNISDRSLARLHTPIGLSIGADNPREIAVAVVAEIISVNTARRGLAGGKVANVSAA